MSTADLDEGYIPASDGVRLCFRKKGSGPDWLIVPGIGGDFDFDRLAEGRTAVFFDIRNRGRSEAVPDAGKVGLPTEVDDVEAVRAAFGVDRVSVVGWSYVGLVAALYAVRYASHVERLVMTCPIPVRDGPPPPPPQTAADAKASEQIANLYRDGLDQSDPVRFAQAWRRIAAQSRMGDPEAVDRLRFDPGGWLNEWPDHMMRAMERVRETLSPGYDYRRDAAEIAASTLIVAGETDTIPGAAMADWVAAIPDAHLVTLSGVGHFPHAEAPDDYFGLVDDFLTEG